MVLPQPIPVAGLLPRKANDTRYRMLMNLSSCSTKGHFPVPVVRRWLAYCCRLRLLLPIRSISHSPKCRRQVPEEHTSSPYCSTSFSILNVRVSLYNATLPSFSVRQRPE